MKKIVFLLVLCTVFFSCTKPPVDDPTLPKVTLGTAPDGKVSITVTPTTTTGSPTGSPTTPTTIGSPYEYKTVTIGNQTWFAENLQTTKYNNGDLISITTTDISSEDRPEYQWAYNNNETNVSTYGRLYTWFAVTDVRGVCPVGWRVPNTYDWKELYQVLGQKEYAGNKLKESGIVHWLTSTGADNSSGFTALPAGSEEGNSFDHIGTNTYFWSTDDNGKIYTAWNWNISNSELQQTEAYKYEGLSVRCIKTK